MVYSRRQFLPFIMALGYGCLALFAMLVANTTMLENRGFAGVLGVTAEGLPLTCGGHYQPTQMVVFASNIPCGKKVKIINLATGQSAIARVASQKVAFNPLQNRVADVSPALAQVIGLNTESFESQAIAVRQDFTWLPVIANKLVTPKPTTEGIAKVDIKALTNNILGECGNCTIPGMVAVAQVTVNRANQAFNNKPTIHQVVYDSQQFSWVNSNPALTGAQANRPLALKIANLTLQGRLSGEALAVQYKLTESATHYYAFQSISAPYWAKSAKMARVRLTPQLEAELQHRFYSLKPFQIAIR